MGCTARDMSAGVSGRGGAKNHVGFTSAVRRMLLLLLLLLGILRSHIIIHRCTSLHCGRRAASELDYTHISFSPQAAFFFARCYSPLIEPTDEGLDSRRQIYDNIQQTLGRQQCTATAKVCAHALTYRHSKRQPV